MMIKIGSLRGLWYINFAVCVLESQDANRYPLESQDANRYFQDANRYL